MAHHGGIRGESSETRRDASPVDSPSDELSFNTVLADHVLHPAMVELKDLLRPLDMYIDDQEGCLPGTRNQIIQDVLSWTSDAGSRGEDTLWLCGVAGSGKSALAISIVKKLHRRNQLGAFVRFDRKDAAKNNPASVIRTIAYQLALFHPRYRSALSAILRDSPNLLRETLSLQLQFDLLLQTPLTTEGVMDGYTIVIVFDALDALDELDKEIGLFKKHLFDSRLPVLRIVFSRPGETSSAADPWLASESDTTRTYDINVNSPQNFADLSKYFRYRMERIRPQDQKTWPGEENIQKLTEMSHGQWVWAHTASDFIESSLNKPTDNPQWQWLSAYTASNFIDSSVDKFTNPEKWDFGEIDKAMDDLYTAALEPVGEWDDTEFIDSFRLAMGIILEARRPLPRIGIATLANPESPSRLVDLMNKMSSIVNGYPVVALLHPSLSAFFFDLSRCRREYWFFEQSALNHVLATCCLKYLQTSIEDRLAWSHPALTYSSEYWVDHVCAGDATLTIVGPLIKNFLRDHFLNWLQVMSASETSRAYIPKLENLKIWVSERQSSDQIGLSKIVDRLSNFVKIHATLIEKHPDKIPELEITFRNLVELAGGQVIPERPPEPTSLSIELVEVDGTADSLGTGRRNGIPERPPEPQSFFVTLTEVEEGVYPNNSIPEMSPGPVMLSVELVEAGLAAEPDSGSLDVGLQLVPNNPPEPMSFVIDLTEYHGVFDHPNIPTPEVPPDPVSFSINLAAETVESNILS